MRYRPVGGWQRSSCTHRVRSQLSFPSASVYISFGGVRCTVVPPLLPVGRSRRGSCSHHHHSRLCDSLKLCFLVAQLVSASTMKQLSQTCLYRRATNYSLVLYLLVGTVVADDDSIVSSHLALMRAALVVHASCAPAALTSVGFCVYIFRWCAEMRPLLPVGRSRRGPCNHHHHSRLYDSLKLCFLVAQLVSASTVKQLSQTWALSPRDQLR